MTDKFDPIDYAMHYGSGCRDCADRNGTCDNETPCNPEVFRAVVAHTLKAWRYGVKHGYIDNPLSEPTP